MIDVCGVPEPHAAFLRAAVARLGEDPRLVGVAAGGSYLSRTMDEFSDLDLVIAVEPNAYASVREDRHRIAQSLGERVEDPAVLWERDGRLTAALKASPAHFPEPVLQWIEDRFWVWVHYGAAKTGRGELFEAGDFLAFLRAQVLGPLCLKLRGARPSGVRRLEQRAPSLAEEMRTTVAAHDARSCALALRSAAEMYRRLRQALVAEPLSLRTEAEQAAMAYLGEVSART